MKLKYKENIYLLCKKLKSENLKGEGYSVFISNLFAKVFIRE